MRNNGAVASLSFQESTGKDVFSEFPTNEDRSKEIKETLRIYEGNGEKVGVLLLKDQNRLMMCNHSYTTYLQIR